MFEGNFRQAGFDAALEGDALRVPEWAGLVARLAAAQDMRRAMAGAVRGNFAHFTSAQPPKLNDSGAGVNPEDSAHRKAAAANMASPASDPAASA